MIFKNKIFLLFIFIVVFFISLISISQHIKNTDKNVQIEEFKKEYFNLYNKETQYFYNDFFIYKRFIFFFNECYFNSNLKRDKLTRDQCIDKVTSILSQYHEEKLINELITNFYSFTTIFNSEVEKLKEKYNIKNSKLPFKI